MSDTEPNSAFEPEQAAKPAMILVRTILGIAFVSAVVLVAMSENPGSLLVTPTSPRPGPYSPEAFGLPDAIGGHTVLAVLDDRNSRCQAPESITVILRASEDSVAGFLESPDGAVDPSVIESELRKAGVPGKLEGVEYASPETTAEQIAVEMDKFNADFDDRECIRSQPITIP